MCTVVLATHLSKTWPILLAANRDEQLNRVWQPPARHWPDQPDVIGGKDNPGGGTWKAVNRHGVVAVVLNRVGSLGPAPNKRSRGELPLLALREANAADGARRVGDIEAALAFYGAIFTFTLRGRAPGHAFIDLGDQFLALAEGPGERAGGTPTRHFGLVVEDREAVRPLVEAAGATILPGGFLDFLDPWNNRIEVVEYGQVQFTKAAAVLAAMGVDGGKDEKAAGQLRDKGMSDGD